MTWRVDTEASETIFQLRWLEIQLFCMSYGIRCNSVTFQDKMNTENNPPTFRAKPPTVLQKQPFVPQKPAKHISGKTQFVVLLWTEVDMF